MRVMRNQLQSDSTSAEWNVLKVKACIKLVELVTERGIDNRKVLSSVVCKHLHGAFWDMAFEIMHHKVWLWYVYSWKWNQRARYVILIFLSLGPTSSTKKSTHTVCYPHFGSNYPLDLKELFGACTARRVWLKWWSQTIFCPVVCSFNS
jgi:hypothetical protein